jgi:subtilisin family serine protease
LQFSEFRNILDRFFDFSQPTINNTIMANNNTLTNLDSLVAGIDFVPGEVIVKFIPETDANSINSALSTLSATVLETTQTLGILRLALNEISVAEAIAIVNNDAALVGTIEYIEPNFIRQTTDTIPNDPLYNELYGLNNTGQTGGTEDADIDAPQAWDNQTGNNVVIGVIDTGVDYNHPDLNDNMWTNPGEIPDNGVDDDGNGFIDDFYGYDFVNEDSNPFDDNRHGTHVAGTIAAEGNNSIGVTGVNWDAQIMALKFLNAGGFGNDFDAIQAIEYAILNGAQLTNNSWGGGGFSLALQDAIAAARDAGQLFIAAAGNNGSNNDIFPFYPASYDLNNIISVAATNDRDQLAGFSNFGAISVDLGAPGVNILSTFPGNNYGFLSGTSMATPHVSGVVALILSENPELTPLEVKELILRTTDEIPALTGITVSDGRLNAFNALGELTPAPDIIGTVNNDVLTGTDRGERIFGLDGDDILQGLGGNDQIFGDNDNDLITGGDGNDTIEGGSGTDLISGNHGDDSLSGQSGQDNIFGGDGNDQINGGSDSDRLLGEAGNDTINGDDGNDIINGGIGSDDIAGGNGGDRIFGGSDNDHISGGVGTDTLIGGFGNDTLDGGEGDDQLIGIDPTSGGSGIGFGAGEVDTLTGGAGSDTFVLADETRVYYSDGDPSTTGDSDFALIRDFDSSEDIIQLQGSTDFYELDLFPTSTGSINAALIYDPGVLVRGEVIAILEDVSIDLTISDPAFSFV